LQALWYCVVAAATQYFWNCLNNRIESGAKAGKSNKINMRQIKNMKTVPQKYQANIYENLSERDLQYNEILMLSGVLSADWLDIFSQKECWKSVSPEGDRAVRLSAKGKLMCFRS
jgi:hypothetical protein